MLNACRRQRSVHSRAVTWCLRSSCAQRLSASKIGSHSGIRLPNLALCRAQRLSASKIGSPAYGLTSRPSISGAQRLSASKIGSPRRGCLPLLRRRVLNACGRQRSVHAVQQGGGAGCRRAQRLSASKIGSPNRSTYSMDGFSGAQRLSASKIGSHQCEPGFPALPDMCSTPVGVKDRFT